MSNERIAPTARKEQERDEQERIAAFKDPHDPTAGFSHNQWYCHQAHQTVFYGVFLHSTPTREKLIDFAQALVQGAPQLAGGYLGARTGQAPDRAMLEGLIEISEVADLDDFPQGMEVQGRALFAPSTVPLFRVVGLARKGGADAKGRAGALFVLSTHALMEGLDSVLLSRSRPVSHASVRSFAASLPAGRRLRHKSAAVVLAPLQLAVALLIAPRRVDRVYHPLTVPRARLRRIAAHYGVRQRSVMFAAAAFALNRGGKGFSKRKLSILYTDLNPAATRASGEDYFHYRMVETRFAVTKAFTQFLLEVDRRLSRADAGEGADTQALLNAVFARHRKMKRLAPALYPERIFRFTGTYHLDLSVVPPVRLSGPLTRDFVAPVFMGTFHPGLNVCVFSPGRDHVTFNFTVRQKLVPGIADVAPLLEGLDPASGGD